MKSYIGRFKLQEIEIKELSLQVPLSSKVYFIRLSLH